jgi:hypothetical protein
VAPDRRADRGSAAAREKLAYGSLLALALAWLVACLWFPLTDTDIWWHLASAKLMWARKAFLREDPFCLASLGAPWIDLHWGFQLIAYAAWKTGGAPFLVAGKCLALAGALAFSLRPHLDRRTWPWLVPMAAFGLYHVRFFIDVRPLALTLLGLGALYAAVTAHLRGRLSAPWRVLVPVQVALVNIQGLYPLGVLLVFFLLLGEWAGRRMPSLFFREPTVPPVPLRPLVLACLAMALAGFASPYGLQGFGLPFSLLGRIAPVASNIFSHEIAENLPFTALLKSRPGQALPVLFLGLAVLFTFDRTRASGGRSFRVSLGHALLFFAFAGLGWMAQRNLPLAFLAGLMAAGRNLQVSRVPEGSDPGPSLRSRSREAFAGLAMMIAIIAIYGPKVRAAWEYELPGSLETPFRFPVAAVDFLEAHPVPGNLFNEIRYGGYLDFRLHPGKLSFVDGRMILRSPAFYRDFLTAVDDPAGFEAYRRRYGITHALLPLSEDHRFLPLAAHLLGREGWSLLFCDGASALLADSSATAAGTAPPLVLDSLPRGHAVRQALSERFGANPRLQSMAILDAARFLRAAGHDRAAADLVSD